MRELSCFFLCIIQVLTFSGLQSQECTGQIKIHAINLEPKEINDLDFLGPLILERNFFFSSEAHGNPYSFKFSQKLITYLASNERLQWVALEADYAHGYALNQFLETGNIVDLEKFIALQTDYTAYREVEYLAHFQYLKGLRDSLGTDFKFVGIDVCKEGFKGSTFTILNLLTGLNSSAEFKSIISTGNNLMEQRKITYRKMQKWVDLIRSQRLQIRKAFVMDGRVFKFKQLENLLFNVEQSIKLRSRKAVNREFQIAENFQRYFDQTDYVFCQFGYGHVLTNRWPKLGDSGKSFVDWLESTDDYKNRAVIFAFSPHVEDVPEFALFGDALCSDFKSEILDGSFPVVVDFRMVPAFNDQFQFVLINER